MKIAIVLSTFSDMKTASEVAEKIVVEELAACVNIIPSLRSIYKWKGKVSKDDEILLIIKTSKKKLKSLIRRIKELHPYELPEIVALSSSNGLKEYLEWVNEL